METVVCREKGEAPYSPVILSKIRVDLKQIATQMLSTVSGTEKCAL